MKLWLLSLIALLAPVTLSAQAAALGPGYITVLGGSVFDQHMVHKFETRTHTFYDVPHYVARAQLDFQNDWMVGMAFGRLMDRKVRFEAEFTYRQHEIFSYDWSFIGPDWSYAPWNEPSHSITGQDLRGVNEPMLITYIANVFLDIPRLLPYFNPFVGAGLGGGHMRITSSHIKTVTDELFDALQALTEWQIVYPSKLRRSYSDNQLVYQVMAGFRIMEDRKYVASIYYRYFSTLSSFKFELYDPVDDALGPNIKNMLTLYTQMQAHSIEFAWSVYFFE